MEILLNKARKSKKLRVYDLANQIGIDSSLMSRILSGKRKATDAQLAKLSQILSIDYLDLLKEKLGSEVADLLYQYPEVAQEALTVAEERITYLLSDQKLQVVPLQEEVSTALKKIDEKHQKWIHKKPLDPIQLQKMQEYFYTEYTFESNRIEGNTLDLQETHLVVNEGITIGGKSMQEHLEAINHKEAIEWVVDFASKKFDFDEHTLKQIHQLILKGINQAGAGVYRTVPVRISGSRHIPPEPYMVTKMMEEYFMFYHIHKHQLHPVILAAEMHERLVSIHPFIDGNGRTSRLVMNLILLRNGYPIVNLKGNRDDRQRYYKALEAVQINHERNDFYRLIVTHALASLQEHLALAGIQ